MRKLMMVIFLMTAILSIVATPALAENWQEEGIPEEVYPKGDVFEIKSPEQLAWIAYKANSGTTFEGKTVLLLNDLDLSAREWHPISSTSAAEPFCGTLDGNGKTIRGLWIGMEDASCETYFSAGLFGKVKNAVFKNIRLENVSIYAGREGGYGIHLGALAGYMEGGRIDNVYTSGTVYAPFRSFAAVGGVVGYSVNTVGYNLGSSCNVRGGGASSSCGVGGIIGRGAKIRNAYFTGHITSGYSPGGYLEAGGIAGTGSVINSYMAGSITAESGPVAAICNQTEDAFLGNYFNADQAFIKYGINIPIAELKDAKNVVALTEQEMKSEEMITRLNQLDKMEAFAWEQDQAGTNQGFPVLKEGSCAPDKYWIAQSDPIAEEQSTFRVNSPAQLAWVAQQVSQGNTFQDKTVILNCPLDLSGKFWTPIGGWDGSSPDETKVFLGTFNGNGQAVRGLSVGSAGGCNMDYRSAGLFGICGENSLIENVVIKDSKIYITAEAKSGALAGVNFGTVRNCSVEGIITDRAYYNILESYYKLKTQCSGGLIGQNGMQGIISKCSSDVNLAFQNAVEVGGLVGHNSGPIDNCYAVGNLDIKKQDTATCNIGGLVGTQAANRVMNCYAIGNITTAPSSFVVGGLFGGFDGTVSRCYWNKDAVFMMDQVIIQEADKKGAGAGRPVDITAIDAKKSIELKQQETFVDWDFSTIWSIEPDKNGGYPYLRGGSLQDNIPVAGIRLDQTSIKLMEGDSAYLTAVFTPANATNQTVTWESADPSIVMVDRYGKVEAVQKGETIVTVTTQDGGYQARCTVTVDSPSNDYIVNSINLSTPGGAPLQQIPHSGNFMVNAQITKNKEFAQTAFLVIACYDSRNRLIRYSYMSGEINSLETISFGTMMAVEDLQGIATIKAFVWDGLNTMNPLSNHLTLPV